MKVRKIGFCIIMLIGAFVLAACGASKEVMTDEMAKQEGKSIGKIYLYGEEHSVQEILDRELEEWEEHYNDEGMRHLFIEKPYYTAEFLNLWMQADNDEILDEIYEDTEGTAACTPQSKAFYKHIKEQCPETIFHGTDVGHQYDTIGKRYLEYLKANGLEEAEQYILAKDCIEQGMHYYDQDNLDDTYRENQMVLNFMREFDKLGNQNIMGIYGAAHTGLNSKDFYKNVPCMATQLKKRYGENITSEDLSDLAR